MKTADLKAGELYAVKYKSGPCLLLSADIHEELAGRGSVTYSPAPGRKPQRDPSKSWGFDKRNYGFLVLNASTEVLAEVDVPALLAAVITEGRGAIPEDAYLDLVTSPAAILGRYEAHLKAERERMAMEDARRDRAKQRRLVAVARHNTVARRLNVALGSESIRLAELDGYSEPTGVALTLAQAERVADLLATHDPEGH